MQTYRTLQSLHCTSISVEVVLKNYTYTIAGLKKKVNHWLSPKSTLLPPDVKQKNISTVSQWPFLKQTLPWATKEFVGGLHNAAYDRGSIVVEGSALGLVVTCFSPHMFITTRARVPQPYYLKNILIISFPYRDFGPYSKPPHRNI